MFYAVLCAIFLAPNLTSADEINSPITVSGEYTSDIKAVPAWKDTKYGVVNAYKGVAVALTGENITVNATLPSTGVKGNYYVFSADRDSKISLGLKEANTRTTITLDGRGAELSGSTAVWVIAAVNTSSKQVRPSKIDINGEYLNITTILRDDMWGAAILANTSHISPTTDGSNRSTVNIDTDATITVGGARNYGLDAFSSGLINVNKNLTLTCADGATTALSTRGQGKININADNDGNVVDTNNVIKITGDVAFDYDKVTSGTKVDGTVNINLTNSQSFWEGSTKYAITGDISDPKIQEDVINQHGFYLNLSNGAVWNSTSVQQAAMDDENNALGAHVYFAPVSQLSLDGGVVNVHNDGQPVVVNKLTGNGTINVAASKQDDGKISAGRLVVGDYSVLKLGDDGLTLSEEDLTSTENGAEGAELAVNYTGINSDDLTSEEFRQLGQTSVQASGATQTQKVAEGLINGEMVQTVNANGEVTSTQVSANTVNQSLRDIGAVTFLGFRTTINDLDKRLGDLRSYSGENGGWVRYLGGQNRYGARNMKLNYNGFQAGFDHRFGEFYAGAAFGYTKGNGHLHNGSSDNDNWNFGLYGGWLGEKGQFVDVIVKRHRFKNEFNLHNTSGVSTNGSYHNWATSFSVETGWRLQCPNNGFYVEPQAEFMFGRMEDGSFKTSQGVKVKQDSVNTTVGRLGVATGYTLPENKGNAYIKASVLHDWSAKVKGSMSKNGLKTSYRDDLSGTWAEFSVGGTYNATKNISAYGEFQTSAGSPIRSPWSASVGVRYSF